MYPNMKVFRIIIPIPFFVFRNNTIKSVKYQVVVVLNKKLQIYFTLKRYLANIEKIIYNNHRTFIRI